MSTHLVRWIAVALTGLLVGCSSNTPTSPSTNDYSSAAQFFSDVLAPMGTSAALTFTLTASNTVAVTLASLTDSAGEPVQEQLTLNVGTMSGSACAPTTLSKVVGAALTAVVAVSLPAGTYCVSVVDQGQLAAPRNFTIRIVTSTGTPAAGTAGTDQLPSTLTRNGRSVKTFTATAQGDVSVTLTGVAGDVVLPVGLALGVWDGSACRLNTSLVTTAGTDPQIAMTVDAGTYCVRLIDVGNLTWQVTISGTIQHP